MKFIVRLPYWLVFFVGIVVGLVITHFVSLERVKVLAFNWQQLLGAFIGAATPLAVFLLDLRSRQLEKERQKKEIEERKRKEFFLFLQKSLVSAINNLASIDTTLHNFMDVNFVKYVDNVIEENKQGRAAVGQTFIPLSAVFVLDKSLLKETTGSRYLENTILDVISNSNDLPMLLQDVSRQFDRTITLNTELGLMKLNNPSVHNQTLLNNLSEFKDVIIKQNFEHNFPIYLRKLVNALVVLQKIDSLGIQGWQKLFPFNHSESAEDAIERIDEYFKDEINLKITEIQKTFKSKLLLMGEKSSFSTEE